MSSYCTHCGARARLGQRFCESCGVRLPEARPTERQAVEEPRSTRFDARIGRTGDRDCIAEMVANVVQRRGEHAYVHTTPTSVSHTDRTGTTVITPVSRGGDARLGDGGQILLLDGNPVELSLYPPSYRHLVCLMNARFAGPNGECSAYSVTTLDLLPEDLLRGKFVGHHVERTDGQLEEAARDLERRGSVRFLAHRPVRATAEDGPADASPGGAPTRGRPPREGSKEVAVSRSAVPPMRDQQDVDAVVARVVGAAAERNEYCYVYRGAGWILVADLRGITIVVPVSSGKRSRLTRQHDRLIVDGRPVDTATDAGGRRRLFCLMPGDEGDSQGERSLPGVTTLPHLGEVLFGEEAVREVYDLELWRESEKIASWLDEQGLRLAHRPPAVMGWWSGDDFRSMLAEVVKTAEESGEFCFVYKGPGFVLVESRRGTTEVIALSNSEEARVSEDGERLHVGGRPVSDYAVKVEGRRRLTCLVRAKLSTSGAAAAAPRNVTTLPALRDELFDGEVARSTMDVEITAQLEFGKASLERRNMQLVYQPPTAEPLWNSTDFEAVLEKLLKVCRERGEHRYVFKGSRLIFIEDRSGTTEIRILANAGRAELSEDGSHLLIDDRRLPISLKDERLRSLLCLTRASLIGPQGEGATYNVTTAERLEESLLEGEPLYAPEQVDERVKRLLTPERLSKNDIELVYRPESQRVLRSSAGSGSLTGDVSAMTEVDEVESLLAEMDRLVGLTEVKEEVKALLGRARTRKRRKELGYPDTPINLHRVFVGNPGTGKTEVARLLGRIYRSLGELSEGHLVEVNRYNLVAGSVAGTISAVRSVVQEALGGILCIGKADILASGAEEGGSFPEQALEVLLKEMDRHRDDLVVVLAGSPKGTEEFVNRNPSLNSQFAKKVRFADLSLEEMKVLFERLCEDHRYALTPGAEERVSSLLEGLYAARDETFENAREVRAAFTYAISNQHARMAEIADPQAEELSTLEAEDIPVGDRSEDEEKVLSEALSELDEMVGLSGVKEEVEGLIQQARHQRVRAEMGLETSSFTRHLVFAGNPGTGKTTVAEIVGRIFGALGLVSRGHVVSTDKSGLVAKYQGWTAPQTKEKVREALGGVLFIDEAYALAEGGDNGFGDEAIEALLTEMEAHRDNLVVIAAGYPREMNRFLDSNPGLASRFKRTIHFEDYSASEMLTIFERLCEKEGYYLTDEAADRARTLFEKMHSSRGENFGNARAVRNVFEGTVENLVRRLSSSTQPGEQELMTIEAVDLPGRRGDVPEEERAASLEKAMAKLNGLTGLSEVKDEVRKLTNLVRIRKMREEKGLVRSMSFHMVFAGNPGTGKTTVARVIAEIYQALGLLTRGHLVEVDRSDLVARHVGHTAKWTKERIKEAKGGILFIDEAYSLARGGESDFGQEAIDTLVKGMEDYREDLIVIAAGYSKEMSRFLSSNPGLESRFEKVIHFEDYSPDEMFEIFRGMCEQDGYELTAEAKTAVRAHLSRLHSARSENFGNARDVRKVFEAAIASQMDRIAALEHITEEDLSTIEAADLQPVGGVGDEDKKRAALAKLEALTGLEGVKRQVEGLANLAQFNAARQQSGKSVTAPSLHTVFTGNPGTGKTTVARLVGEIYAALGILSKGHVVEVSRGDLVGEYKGHTAVRVREVARRAAGGVLFVDEAYSLNPSNAHSDFEREAINTLLVEMENRRADLVVIAAGYTEPMRQFLESNPGLKSRFTQTVHFEDYSPEELLDIFESMAEADGYELNDAARLAALHEIKSMHASRDDTFGNARAVRTLYERVTNNLANRLAGADELTEDELTNIEAVDLPGQQDEGEGSRSPRLEETLARLNRLTGLAEVKEEVQTLANLAKANRVRQEAGLDPESVASHFVFTGNPGTGKTTVAEIIGEIFGSLGLLSRGHTVSASQPDLVDKWLGGTEERTRKIIKSALGGVLFIDEAYSLTESDSPRDPGRKAINVLLTEMEKHRDDLVVIAAGYPRQMEEFVRSDPGLERRFTTTIRFQDYSPTELLEIFEGVCASGGNRLTDEARDRARWLFDWLHANRDENFGNAGAVRNVYERVVRRRANRLKDVAKPTRDMLLTFEASDIPSLG